DQFPLTAPTEVALVVRRLDKDSVRVYLLKDEALLPLLGEEEPPELPDDVREFSRAHGILEYVEKALQAAREVFSHANRVGVSLKEDEYGETYVDIHAVVPEDVEAEVANYSACVERWVSFFPPHVGSIIQLSTSWAGR